MLIVLNGYPGVGKLTIGRALADRINGRLLDIHSVYNLAFALTDCRSEDFYYAVRKSENLADELIDRLPVGVPVIFTTVLAGDGDKAREDMDRFARRTKRRGPLFMVHLHCGLEENKRRITSEARGGMRKPRDTAMVERNHAGGAVLCGGDLPNLLKLDVTDLQPTEAASAIAAWLNAQPQRHL